MGKGNRRYEDLEGGEGAKELCLRRSGIDGDERVLWRWAGLGKGTG